MYISHHPPTLPLVCSSCACLTGWRWPTPRRPTRRSDTLILRRKWRCAVLWHRRCPLMPISLFVFLSRPPWQHIRQDHGRQLEALQSALNSSRVRMSECKHSIVSWHGCNCKWQCHAVLWIDNHHTTMTYVLHWLCDTWRRRTSGPCRHCSRVFGRQTARRRCNSRPTRENCSLCTASMSNVYCFECITAYCLYLYISWRPVRLSELEDRTHSLQGSLTAVSAERDDVRRQLHAKEEELKDMNARKMDELRTLSTRLAQALTREIGEDMCVLSACNSIVEYIEYTGFRLTVVSPYSRREL